MIMCRKSINVYRKLRFQVSDSQKKKCTKSEDKTVRYTLSAIMEFTISLSFSFKAFTALFRDTLAWAMTSSISLASSPESSTSSLSSSSSSFFASLPLPALPLSPDSFALPPLAACSAFASCWAAEACA